MAPDGAATVLVEAASEGEEAEKSGSESEEDDVCLKGAGGRRRRKEARGIEQLISGDVFIQRRFGVPIWRVGLGLFTELLFCLSLTRSGWLAGGEEPETTTAARWAVITAWLCFFAFMLARGGLVLLWQTRSWGDGQLAALYMLGSSLQFLVYISLQYVMYSASCRVTAYPEAFLNRVDGNCTRAYRPPPICDGAAEAYRSPHACCLVYRHVLHEPDSLLVKPVGDLLSWASVVVAAFAWQDVPFVPVAPGYIVFMSTLWLDLLDAVVFSGFLEDKHATYPAHGINLDTTRSQPQDRKLLGILWFIFTFAYATALLSRSFYAFLRFSVGPKVQASRRTLADTVSELLRSVRLLDQTRAQMLVGEAVRLQGESYRDADSEEDGTPVVVDAPAPSIGWADVQTNPTTAPRCRRGWAEMVQPGEYVVDFEDGMRPWQLTLPVDRLEPNFAERLQWFGPGSCRGWGDPRHLLRGEPLERFNKLAKVLDAFRSLICLELPFLAVRLGLEVRATGRCSVWLLKNLVFAAINVMTIAACGNEGAKFLASRPLRWISDLFGGTQTGQIWPWAEGLHRVAADPAARALSSQYRQDLERLSQHKAWLTLECEKAEDQAAALGTEEGVFAARAPYEAELRRLDLELARVASQLRLSAT